MRNFFIVLFLIISNSLNSFEGFKYDEVYLCGPNLEIIKENNLSFSLDDFSFLSPNYNKFDYFYLTFDYNENNEIDKLIVELESGDIQYPSYFKVPIEQTYVQNGMINYSEFSENEFIQIRAISEYPERLHVKEINLDKGLNMFVLNYLSEYTSGEKTKHTTDKGFCELWYESKK